ncbi:hypothetical protein L3Q82_009562, partial [Scortum barcoo]
FTRMRAAVGIWILSVVICMGRGDHHFGHHQGDQDTTFDSSTNSVSLVTSANKQFAFRLYRKLAAQADSQSKNIFFSPVSVSVALAALSVGARGETHLQLFSGLGFNNSVLTQRDVDQAFQTLLQRENNTMDEDISEGTAVFLHNSFKPQPEFLETLKQSYFAEGFNVDFSATDSINTINKYVEEKTNGKINKLVENLEDNTVMYLISYIYYKGKWATQFNPELTMMDTFTVDENTKVDVQMMNMQADFEIVNDQTINTIVLHLPFNNSYSMLLLLPEDMATLENAISPDHVTKWLESKTPRSVHLYIPKFSIKTCYSLNEVLTQMGMSAMFGDHADFHGISETVDLLVSEVVHQATLDVDEAGATAAASTGIGITFKSLNITPTLKFNRPFMVIITERSTEEILFTGKIINPKI